MIHEGAGRWKQVWALLKRSLLPRQFQDEETIRKKRRKKTRSEKKPLFFLRYLMEFIPPCLLFSQCIHRSIPCLSESMGKTVGKPAIIAKIAYDNKTSGKKKNLLVLCCLLFSPYHKGDHNGCNSTNQRKSPEDVGEKSNCNIG